MNKKVYIFAPIFLVLVLIATSLTSFYKDTNQICNKVLRLHIVANSDSNYDQNIKLKLKDFTLLETEKLLKDAKNITVAVNIIKENIENLENNLNLELLKFNYSKKVICHVEKEYFRTRYYNGFTLPAGYYNSLKIVIGEGSGHNWWCVVYPTVCISGCIDEFSSSLSDEEKEFVTNDRYIPKFKIFELYNNIKNKIIS